jgi:hypothetical protein
MAPSSQTRRSGPRAACDSTADIWGFGRHIAPSTMAA